MDTVLYRGVLHMKKTNLRTLFDRSWGGERKTRGKKGGKRRGKRGEDVN